MNLKLLFNKNFALTFWGRFISRIGTCLQSIALSLYVLEKTGDAKLFASVLAVAALPQIILGPLAGVLIDRFNRKKIIVGLDLLNGVIIALFIGIFIKEGSFNIGHIYIIELTLNTIGVFFDSAMGTVLPTIMKKDELPDANSMVSFSNSFANIAGPIVAGIIYGFNGILVLMAINCISFIVSGISEMFIDLPHKKKDSKLDLGNFMEDFKGGINYIVHKKDLIAICITAVILNFSLSPFFSVVMPFVIKQKFLLSDSAYGTFMSLISIGMMVGPVAGGYLMKKYDLKKLCSAGFYFLSLLIFSTSFIFLNSIQSRYEDKFMFVILLGVCSVLSIAVVTVCNITIAVNFQQIVPNELLGRVGGVLSTLSLASIPLGQMTIGCIMKSISLFGISMVVAIILFIGSFVFTVLMRNTEIANEVNQDLI